MIGKVESSISVLAKAVLASALVLAPLEPCMAQSWLPWGGNFFDAPPRYYAPHGYRGRRDDRRKSSKREDKVRLADTVKDGGPQPEIAAKAPPIVAFPYSFPVRSIVIDTSSRKLYFVVDEGRAYAYPIAVGRTDSAGRGPRRSAASRLGPIGILPPKCGHVMRACLRR